MDERGMSLAMRAAVMVAVLASVRSASAQITLTASNTNLLYSKEANPDCSALSKVMPDSGLPRNVSRLRVAVPGGIEGRTLRFAWSMKKSSKGTLAADLDIGAGTEVPAIDAMCADFGNACVLTKDRLKFYNEPTILWVAPTCAVLPNDTRKAFRGGVSHVQVKVLEGKRRLGKAKVDLHWGMNGSVTMFVTDLDGKFQNGMPSPFPVQVFADPIFGFDVVAPSPVPPGAMTPDYSGGGTASEVSCPTLRFDDCSQIIFPSASRFIVVLTLFFEDKSALCDNIAVNVAKCNPGGRLDVIPRPKRAVYDPAQSTSDVDLTVRLRNTSQPKGGLPGCNFLLRGANVLSCSSTLKLGSVNDSSSTGFDLRHCSETTDQPCDTDGDCSQAVCGDCRPNETCLTKPHCAKHVEVACGNDADCAARSTTCPTCTEDENCVRVLDQREIFLRPGESADLLSQPVMLRNVTGTTAKIKDTWTATVLIPQLSLNRTLKYAIRGRPTVQPAPQ